MNGVIDRMIMIQRYNMIMLLTLIHITMSVGVSEYFLNYAVLFQNMFALQSISETRSVSAFSKVLFLIPDIAYPYSYIQIGLPQKIIMDLISNA